MIIVMKTGASQLQIDGIEKFLKEHGFGVHISVGTERTIIGAIGDERILAVSPLEVMAGVDKVMPVVETYKLVSRNFRPESTVIKVKDQEIGSDKLAIMAGPCSVESPEQILETALHIKSRGANFLRGGAYKPRTSPYSFQGLEEEGFRMLAEAGREAGLPVISEVVSTVSLEQALKHIDMVQVGTRNMQNFHLLKEIGKLKIPVLLKRGLASTVEEWLNAAEHIMSGGNYNVVLCERGIRTFETATRFTLDLSAVPLIKELSHLPVLVDPSHGTGKSKLVAPMSRAAIAAGADGLMIEVHPNPKEALSDGPQSLDFMAFDSLMDDIVKIAGIVGKKVQI